MWFNPSELLPESAKPPANFANFANSTGCDQQATPEISKISRISSPLSTVDRAKLLAYMAAIDECDPEMIDELLTKCAKDADKLAWALAWADKVLNAAQSSAAIEIGLIPATSVMNTKLLIKAEIKQYADTKI